MNKLLALILVGFSVGLDNFAISIAMGLSGLSRRHRLRNSLVFCGFETGMPIVGFIVGRTIAGSLGSAASIFGGALLVATGLYTIVQDLLIQETDTPAPNSIKRLLIMGLSISIDSLVVGFSLGATKEPLAETVIIIGIFSIILSLLGMELGSRLKSNIESYSELFGGAILIIVGILIGFKVL
ncbi:MAG TPA: manganese efflux pump [Candidatus Saccharimonadales bacterium]|nr:manganese efflux pump [Candidatus Saccharimonadales bacterium]